MDVLAGAAFTFHGPGKEGFQSTWKRVRPPNKPEDGIPFDVDDPMFDATDCEHSQLTISSPTEHEASRFGSKPAPNSAERAHCV